MRKLRPHPLETLPVELDAMTRTVRRHCATILDPQRLRNVTLKSEPMGFQVTAVRTGDEQMHGDIMGAVARHR
jgi:hypothetical protein